MSPATFGEVVDRKIDFTRTRMELGLTANSIPCTEWLQIRKDFDATTAKLRAIGKEASKDGR